MPEKDLELWNLWDAIRCPTLVLRGAQSDLLSAETARAMTARGDGEWGRGMQDDVDDGVAWLAKRGTIDAKRVCIMGASYGGYAAM